MKILFCTSGLVTGGGGIASYAHDFIEAFKEGNEFVVVTNDGYKEKKDDPFNVMHFNMNDFSLDNAKQFMNFIIITKPQLIVNSAFPLLSLVTPYLDNNIKVINVAHFVDGKLLLISGLNANYADTTIAQSTFAKENLRRFYKLKDETKVDVVYNFMPPLAKVNLKEKKQCQTLKIVFPGGSSIAKSVDIVAMVLKRLLRTNLQFEFYWIGHTTLPGSNWPFVKTKNISDCIDKNDPRIKVFGPVPREEAKHIMADANIFLLPSRGEGCPITLLEAMRGGCIPIISDAKHGSLDLIKNGQNGFVVKQNSVRQIVELITKIINNHQQYDNIYNASLQKFNNDLQYHVWKNKMRQILARSNKHRHRKQFSNNKYELDVIYIKFRYLMFWLQARFCFQPYIMIIFRYIKYLYK